MPAAGVAIGIDALPDEVLQTVLGKLTLEERLRISTVCRRWHAITLLPPLLAQLDIRACDRSNGDSWLEVLNAATAWLVQRAAGSVQQLSIDIYAAYDLNTDEVAEAAALVAGALAAVGAGGQLRELRLHAEGELPLRLGGWAAGLHGLERLSVYNCDAPVVISGGLQGLTALRSLRLYGSTTGITASAHLPNSLTSLRLGPDESERGYSINQTLPIQVAGLTNLEALYLDFCYFKSHQYGSLAALSRTLQSLTLQVEYLPDCLPDMLALRTLDVLGCGTDADEGGNHNMHLLKAALRRLPRLECLKLSQELRRTFVLLPGPWQRTLRQLTADARLLAASMSALGEASRLEELSVSNAGRREQQGAARRLLRWATDQQALPLRRLMLPLPTNESPTAALFDTCMALKGRHPHLDIQLKKPSAD